MSHYEDELSKEEQKKRKKLKYGSDETQDRYKKLQKGINAYSSSPEWINRIRGLFKSGPVKKPLNEQDEE